uniref:Uncharacterized protein n=1 Tax=Oryza brachyantha TaxID=4533 RepID=J3MEL7_ORYBR
MIQGVIHVDVSPPLASISTKTLVCGQSHCGLSTVDRPTDNGGGWLEPTGRDGAIDRNKVDNSPGGKKAGDESRRVEVDGGRQTMGADEGRRQQPCSSTAPFSSTTSPSVAQGGSNTVSNRKSRLLGGIELICTGKINNLRRGVLVAKAQHNNV